MPQKDDKLVLVLTGDQLDMPVCLFRQADGGYTVKRGGLEIQDLSPAYNSTRAADELDELASVLGRFVLTSAAGTGAFNKDRRGIGEGLLLEVQQAIWSGAVSPNVARSHFYVFKDEVGMAPKDEAEQRQILKRLMSGAVNM